MVDLRAGPQNLISAKFIFAHFSTHCRTDENIVVPAEGAIVEMSLEGGILQSWHSFLPPGNIPAGLYKSGNYSILAASILTLDWSSNPILTCFHLMNFLGKKNSARCLMKN